MMDNTKPVPESPARFSKERDEAPENARNENSTTFPGAGYREASMDKNATHPIMHGDEEDYIIDDHEFDDIPWHDPNNTLPAFDAQQGKGNTVMDAGKKKASIAGRLVRLTADHHITGEHRKASMSLNMLAKDMIGRIVAKEGPNYIVYFPKIGAVSGIPHNIIADFQDEYTKQAAMEGKEGILVNHKGAFTDTEDRFQVLDFDDDNVTFRYLTGNHMGETAVFPMSNFTKGKVKWASASTVKLASFKGEWDGKSYRLSETWWNEKQAGILDKVEGHLDNVQNDITYVMPRLRGQYKKSFTVKTARDGHSLTFNAHVAGNSIQVDVSTQA